MQLIRGALLLLICSEDLILFFLHLLHFLKWTNFSTKQMRGTCLDHYTTLNLHIQILHKRKCALLILYYRINALREINLSSFQNFIEGRDFGLHLVYVFCLISISPTWPNYNLCKHCIKCGAWIILLNLYSKRKK